MENNKSAIQVTGAALAAIQGLQHKAGVYKYYRHTLDCLFTAVLYMSDELGMGATETTDTLRVLDSIRRDLAAIAGPSVAGEDTTATETAPIAASVEIIDDEAPELDPPAAMLSDIARAYWAADTLKNIVAEAEKQAVKAGQKFEAVKDELVDIQDTADLLTAQLDRLQAIDLDTFDDTPKTDADRAREFLRNAYQAAHHAVELVVDGENRAKLEAGAFSAELFEKIEEFRNRQAAACVIADSVLSRLNREERDEHREGDTDD